MSGDCRLSSPMARALLVAAPTTQHSPSSPNFLAALHLCLASPLPRHLPLRRRSQPMAVLRRNSTERVSSALLPAKPSPLELMEQNERDSLQLVYDFCQCWLTKSAQRSVATFLLFLQLSLPLPLIDWDLWLSPPADAVLYSPNTKVPRTGELALRRAIPANANMKAIQESLEDISYLLRIPQKKPYGTMEADVKKSLKILQEGKDSILGGMPAGNKEKGSELYSSLLDGKGGLQELIRFIKEQNADKVSVGLSNSLDTVAELELLQASGLSFLLPDDYLKYPRLTGRGIVEFTIEKADGSTFFPASGGEPKSMATIQVVVDGYSAPLTAGNFAKLVIDGAYDGVKLKCTSQAVLSDNEVEGKGYRVPLEVMPSGQFEPLYKTTLSIQDGELPVLPLSVYGAVAMAHSAASEEYSSPSQFFFYLYDKRNSGLGGLSFDEGQFSVFGYTTSAGRDVLSQIKSGDIIRSAKLIQGQDRLVLPNEN